MFSDKIKVATEGLDGFCDILSRFLALNFYSYQKPTLFHGQGCITPLLLFSGNFQHFEGCMKKKYRYRVMIVLQTIMLQTEFSPESFPKSQ